MQMAVTVGEVLYQRENPLPFAWRCHLDKARENEVGMSGRQDESLASHMKEQGVEKESYKKKQKWGSDVNRIHLDKAGENEVGMSGRQEENTLGLKRSVRKKSVPLKFKSSPIECDLKIRSTVPNKLKDGTPEETKKTE